MDRTPLAHFLPDLDDPLFLNDLERVFRGAAADLRAIPAWVWGHRTHGPTFAVTKVWSEQRGETWQHHTRAVHAPERVSLPMTGLLDLGALWGEVERDAEVPKAGPSHTEALAVAAWFEEELRHGWFLPKKAFADLCHPSYRVVHEYQDGEQYEEARQEVSWGVYAMVGTAEVATQVLTLPLAGMRPALLISARVTCQLRASLNE